MSGGGSQTVSYETLAGAIWTGSFQLYLCLRRSPIGKVRQLKKRSESQQQSERPVELLWTLTRGRRMIVIELTCHARLPEHRSVVEWNVVKPLNLEKKAGNEGVLELKIQIRKTLATKQGW